MEKAHKGYTWWTKDWRSSDNIFELDLCHRGLFRELIDSAMDLDNNTPYKPKTWSRMFNCDLKTLLEMLKTLEDMGLIVIENEILFIPSCEKRLANKRNGAKGGKVKPPKKQSSKQNDKQNSKRTNKQTETETETETETYNLNLNLKENQNSDRSEIKISSPSSFKQWKNEDLKNEMVIAISDLKNDGVEVDKNEALKFYEYWTEETASKKPLLTLQKSWNTKRRLKTWIERSNKFNKKETKLEPTKSAYAEMADRLRKEMYG